MTFNLIYYSFKENITFQASLSIRTIKETMRILYHSIFIDPIESAKVPKLILI